MLYLVQTPQDNGHRHLLIEAENMTGVLEKLQTCMIDTLADKGMIVGVITPVQSGVYEVYQLMAMLDDRNLTIKI